MNEERQIKKPDIDNVIKAVSDSECKEYPSVGMGTGIRLKGERIIGAGLLSENRLIHLSIFPKRRSSNSNYRSRMSRPRTRRENM